MGQEMQALSNVKEARYRLPWTETQASKVRGYSRPIIRRKMIYVAKKDKAYLFDL